FRRDASAHRNTGAVGEDLGQQGVVDGVVDGSAYQRIGCHLSFSDVEGDVVGAVATNDPDVGGAGRLDAGYLGHVDAGDDVDATGQQFAYRGGVLGDDPEDCAVELRAASPVAVV